MSELSPGTGYESLPEVSRAFVDYVNDHARQGAWADKESGPSPAHAGFLYDVDVSDSQQVIPFDRVLFEDNKDPDRGDGRDRVQKDQVSFFFRNVRLAALYHEFGGYGGNSLLLWSGKAHVSDPGEAIVTAMVHRLRELEQSGRMVPSANQHVPE